MRKIFVALIIIFIILLILVSGFFVLTLFSGRVCTQVGCLEGVKVYTTQKFSDEISVYADDELLFDLCQFNETERERRLEGLYRFSDLRPEINPYLKISFLGENYQRFIDLKKYKISDIDVWKIFIQPNCEGQKQLLYEIDESDVEIRKSYPNGKGCGSCENGVIDLSS